MTTAQIDTDKLMAFVFRAVDEVGATLNCALVHMGDQLGYYRDLAAHGPTTPEELASRTGTALPYAREWLNAQAAGQFVEYDAAAGRYTLPPEHAVALTDESSPAYLPGFFQIALGTARDSHRVVDVARTTGGLGWHEHNGDVHEGCERFFRPGYAANLVSAWLPSLDGVVEKLEAGSRRRRRRVRPRRLDGADGAGVPALDVHGLGLPRRVGGDGPRPGGRGRGRGARRLRARVGDRVRRGGLRAGHDVRLPARHGRPGRRGPPRPQRDRVRRDLDGGRAGRRRQRLEDNLNPVGRAYYGFSTLLCTPASLSQPVGAALGTQAGPARIRDVVTEAGFTRFRVAAQTPFNNVYEVRP